MTEVASRELRNATRALLNRVAQGESVVITVDGHAVAQLKPIGRRPQWIRGDEFVSQVMRNQADPALATDLAALCDESTDDLAFQ